jgi:hypothetical protein
MNDFELSYYKERFDLIQKLAKQTYERLTAEAIAEFKRRTAKSGMSGSDSGLENAWEEYKYQIQNEHGPFLFAYEQEIERICDELVSTMPIELNKLLWIWTREFEDAWSEEDENVSFDTWHRFDVVSLLKQEVVDIAMNERLLVDPDEDSAREQFEEDNSYFEDEE